VAKKKSDSGKVDHGKGKKTVARYDRGLTVAKYDSIKEK